jgi:glycosyltransferase involved in cell wall biosynthesis
VIRVLHSIDTTGPGGAETVFVNLATGLDPNKFESIVAIRGGGWVCDTLCSYGIEPIFVQSKGGVNFRYLRELVEIIRTNKIDIVQSHLLGSNLYCCLAGMICRVPVIATFHGFVDASEQERFMALKVWIINQGSRSIVFVSDGLRDQFMKAFGFSKTKSVTVYNGVDTNIFYSKRDTSIREKLGLKKEHVLIGAVGNIRPTKGYDLFLRAARIVYDKNPACRFVVAGQGTGELYDSLLQLRKKLNLDDVFCFLGFQNDAPKFLNNLDIFCLPSTSEGFSMSTIEAMACGVPVVATRSGGPEEIINDGKEGKLVLANVEGLANGMMSMIDDFLIRQQLIFNSVNSMNVKFISTDMIKKYENIYSCSCL